MAASFNALNVCYSAGLQFRYGGAMPELNLALTALFLALTLAAALLLALSPASDSFGEFRLHFRPSSAPRRNFFLLTLLYRAALGLSLGLFN